MYIITEAKIKESFQSGSANSIINKIINIVNRRITGKVVVSDIPYTYHNDYGTFAGFYGFLNEKQLFRLNFLLNKSDSLYSLDLYDGDTSQPLVTVFLNEFNVVQSIEAIVDEFENPNMSIRERNDSEHKEYTSASRKKMLFESWLKEEPDALDLLQNKKIADVYVAFLKKDKVYNKEVNLMSFTQLAKEHLFNLGLTNPTFRPRKKGSIEKEVVDKALEDKFLDIVQNMQWQEKFEFMKGALVQMYKGNVNSIYIYGNPGTGKSYDVVGTLDKVGADYKLYKGNVIKGTDDLFRILYNNREDSILVFDDADKVLQATNPDIWKTLLENVKEREITYADVKRNRNKNIADIPPVFTFTSGVVFISNSPKLNSAIASRSIVLNVSLSNEEALAKIEATLKEFLPDVDMKIKKEALEYAREISNGIKNIDYRSVEKIIIARQINPKDWKKYALWMLAS